MRRRGMKVTMLRGYDRFVDGGISTIRMIGRAGIWS